MRYIVTVRIETTTNKWRTTLTVTADTTLKQIEERATQHVIKSDLIKVEITEVKKI